MQFAWDEVNENEIQARGIDKETAESVFWAEDFAFCPHSAHPNRWIAEGTVKGKLYRVPFSKVFPMGIRITTAFQVSRKRRRT